MIFTAQDSVECNTRQIEIEAELAGLGVKRMRHSRGPNAKDAMNDFFRQARRCAGHLGLDMEQWLDKYLPSSDESAGVIYNAVFRAKAMLDARVDAQIDEVLQ